MVNAYRGETPIRIDGHDLTLVYDWDALGKLKTEFGSAEFGELLGSGDLAVLSKVIAVGLARHHPEWTAERIHALAPPIMPTIQAVSIAFNYAWRGVDPGKGVSNPPKRAAGMIRAGMRLLWRLVSPSASVSRRPISGA